MTNYEYPETPPFTHPTDGGWTQRERHITEPVPWLRGSVKERDSETVEKIG